MLRCACHGAAKFRLGTTRRILSTYTTVIRYDNNVVTIPFVGKLKEAQALRDRMTHQTHKHQVLLFPTARKTVPVGPYRDLDAAEVALKETEKTSSHVVLCYFVDRSPSSSFLLSFRATAIGSTNGQLVTSATFQSN